MANEIQLIHDDGAETVYAIVRDMLGNWYHGTNPEAFDDANWGDYDIALAEVHAAASGNVAVQATFPAVAAGFYWIDVYVQAGANPAQTDLRVCSCLMYWNATALVPAGGAADVRQIDASEEAAANVKSVFTGELVVRGTLVPDVSGIYERGTEYDGHGTWARQGGGWFLWYYAETEGWIINATIGTPSSGEDPCWGKLGTSNPELGTYLEGGSATGSATVAIVAGSDVPFASRVQGSAAAALAAYPVPLADDVQGSAAAALAAYDSDGGVAKESSVGAIATILSGITSLAHWLRGLYNKRAMNSEALTEIRDTTGTFDPTTDSNEAIADKTSGLTAQQTRDAMKLAPSNGAPIAGSIDAELDIISGGGGAITDTILVTDPSDFPVDSADVWITNDVDGTDGGVKIAGSAYTDDNGRATFSLDNGNYWVHVQKSGLDFTATYPKKLTVAGGIFSWA